MECVNIWCECSHYSGTTCDMHACIVFFRIATTKMATALVFSFSYKGKEYLFVEETKKNLEALEGCY